MIHATVHSCSWDNTGLQQEIVLSTTMNHSIQTDVRGPFCYGWLSQRLSWPPLVTIFLFKKGVYRPCLGNRQRCQYYLWDQCGQDIIITHYYWSYFDICVHCVARQRRRYRARIIQNSAMFVGGGVWVIYPLLLLWLAFPKVDSWSIVDSMPNSGWWK